MKCHVLTVVAVLVPSVALAPISARAQSFTVDPPSIGLPGTAVNALAPAPEHIFNNVSPPGPVPPGIGFSGSNFVDLLNPNSPDRDALSVGYEPLDSDLIWDIMFSVDRGDQGLPGTGVAARAAGGNAVGGDYYFVNPHLGPGMNAVMTLTDVHHGLANGPASQQEGRDNIDGAEIWDSRKGVEVPYEGFNFLGDAVFDSVVGTAGGDAHIRRNNTIAFHATELGLTEEDNVDALALDIGFERNDNVDGPQDGIVEALFSLAPGSKSLFGPDGEQFTPDDLSPADIFYTDFSGKFDIAGPSGLLGVFPGNLNFPFDLTASKLGLNFHFQEDNNDNVDAIDLIQTRTIYDFPEDPPNDPGEPAIPPPPCGPLADWNCDQHVDGKDLEIWEARYGTNTGAYGPGDATAEGDVAGSDFIIWQRQYMPPSPSPAASVPEPTTGILLMLSVAAILMRRCKVVSKLNIPNRYLTHGK